MNTELKNELKAKRLLISTEHSKIRDKRNRVTQVRAEIMEAKDNRRKILLDLKFIRRDFVDLVGKKTNANRELKLLNEQLKMLRGRQSSLHKAVRQHHTAIKAIRAEQNTTSAQTCQPAQEVAVPTAEQPAEVNNVN